MLDTIVRGGTIVTDGTSFNGFLAISNGTIVGLWADSDGMPLDAMDAKEIVDATDKIVMPGAIDAHLHTQTGAAYFSTRADDMRTVTQSAAFGGITTVMPYVWGDPDQPVREYLERFFDLAGGLAVCDFAAHCGVRPDMALIAQIPDAFALGVTSFKMQYAYRRTGQGRMADDDHRMAALEIIGRNGGVGMFHCENGYIIDYLETKFASAGLTTVDYYEPSRPAIVEAEAIHRTVVLGELADCPVYVVHLTSARGLAEVRAAQAEGKHVYTETCPQYLTLTNDELLARGAIAKVGPPLRYSDDVIALWDGLASGVIETIGSDHSAHTLEHKMTSPDDVFGMPDGTSVVELMLPLIYTEGVVKGRLTIEDFVRVFCSNPARRFGLFPRKGTLRPGADADVLIWDPQVRWVVDAKTLSNPAGYTVFDGWKLEGKPWRSWLRGQPLLRDNRIWVKPGGGIRLDRQPATRGVVA